MPLNNANSSKMECCNGKSELKNRNGIIEILKGMFGYVQKKSDKVL